MVLSFLALLRDRHGAALDSRPGRTSHMRWTARSRMRALIHSLLEYGRLDVRGGPSPRWTRRRRSWLPSATLGPALVESRAVVTHDPLPW